jgi:cobalt-zinc-cadmium efflux system protein
LTSDAVHDLGDSLSLGLSWFLERTSRRGRDRRYSYGYRRFSLLAVLVQTAVLTAGIVFVLARAVPRIARPEPPDAPGMAAFAVLGVLANGAAVLRLRRDRTLHARMIVWHLAEDALGWLAVLAASGVMLVADVPVLDPLLSIAVAVFLLVKVIGILRDAFRLLLQGVPPGVDLERVQADVESVPGVRAVHHAQAWSLDGQHHVLTAHVVVSPRAGRNRVMRVKSKVRAILRKYGFSHITVEIEYGEDDCAMR